MRGDSLNTLLQKIYFCDNLQVTMQHWLRQDYTNTIQARRKIKLQLKFPNRFQSSRKQLVVFIGSSLHSSNAAAESNLNGQKQLMLNIFNQHLFNHESYESTQFPTPINLLGRASMQITTN